MKKLILMVFAALGFTALAAQTSPSDPVIIPSPAALPAQTPYQPSMGSNTLEVVTPTGTEVITPTGTEMINNNPPATTTTTVTPVQAITPNTMENNPAGINNATPNLSLPQNQTQY